MRKETTITRSMELWLAMLGRSRFELALMIRSRHLLQPVHKLVEERMHRVDHAVVASLHLPVEVQT